MTLRLLVKHQIQTSKNRKEKKSELLDVFRELKRKYWPKII